MFGWIKGKKDSGVDYGKKVIGAEAIKETNKAVVDMAKEYLSPKKMIENSRQETFEEARRRLGASDADLIQNYKNFALSFYISLFFAFACFIGFLYYIFIAKLIVASLAMLSIMSVCVVNSFRFSFRAFQIKHRKLCSVKDWWDRAGDWFPSINLGK